MSSQKAVTPKVSDCYKCGKKARAIDWDFNDRWQVMCDGNHTATGKCNSPHRAICKWNNKQEALKNV